MNNLYLYSNKIVFFIVIIFVGLLGTVQPSVGVRPEIEAEAARRLPLKADPAEHYTYDEIAPIFRPLLEGTFVRGKFEEYFRLLFTKTPIHPPVVVTKGFQCLLARIMEVNLTLGEKVRALGKTALETDLDCVEEEIKHTQMEEIFKTLGFHKAMFPKLNKELGDAIPDFPCPACREAAIKESGIEELLALQL